MCKKDFTKSDGYHIIYLSGRKSMKTPTGMLRKSCVPKTKKRGGSVDLLYSNQMRKKTEDYV